LNTNLFIKYYKKRRLDMNSKIIMIIVLGVFLTGGCVSYNQSVKKYRSEKIQMNNPGWDQTTVRKVAGRKVEVGMTDDMVVAALGRPDSISRHGAEQKWGYAIRIERGMGDYYNKFVYFVYLKNGIVVREAGDRSKLVSGHLSWHE